MRKVIWSNKAIVIIVVMAMLSSMGMVGCSNVSDNRNAETAANIAQSPEAESEESGEEDVQQTETVPTEEPESTPEPTIEPTPEEEVVELPEIDERYEYQFCCFDDSVTSGPYVPLIGLNIPEGWEAFVNGSLDGNTATYMSFTERAQGYYYTIWVECEHLAQNPLETDEQAAVPYIILEKEEKTVIDTAFGKAEIFWISRACQDDARYDVNKNLYEDRAYEEDGKKYAVDYEEVAVMSISKGGSKEQIFFRCCGCDDSYGGVLEEVLPQMLEPQ